MARDEDMDIDLEVNLDGDQNNFVDYNWKEEDTEEIADLTMEVEMNPVFLLIHHIEVIRSRLSLSCLVVIRLHSIWGCEYVTSYYNCCVSCVSCCQLHPYCIIDLQFKLL